MCSMMRRVYFCLCWWPLLWVHCVTRMWFTYRHFAIRTAHFYSPFKQCPGTLYPVFWPWQTVNTNRKTGRERGALEAPAYKYKVQWQVNTIQDARHAGNQANLIMSRAGQWAAPAGGRGYRVDSRAEITLCLPSLYM